MFKLLKKNMQILCKYASILYVVRMNYRKYLQGVCTYCTVRYVYVFCKNHAVSTNTGKYNATDVLCKVHNLKKNIHLAQKFLVCFE